MNEKLLRLRRIVPSSGKTIIVPIDHGIEGYFEQLENYRSLVEALITGGADALLVRRGLLARVLDVVAGRTGIVYRLSGATATSPDLQNQRLLDKVLEAVRIGADAVVFTVTIGHPMEADQLVYFGEVVDQASEFGMPVIGEAEPWSKIPEEEKFEVIRQGARTLSEQGADIVKTFFPRDTSLYPKIVKYSLAPIVAAGGPRLSSQLEVLKFVKAVMEAGAIGTCMGRNIWGWDNPQLMVKAVSLIVKQGATVEEAYKVLESAANTRMKSTHEPVA